MNSQTPRVLFTSMLIASILTFLGCTIEQSKSPASTISSDDETASGDVSSSDEHPTATGLQEYRDEAHKLSFSYPLEWGVSVVEKSTPESGTGEKTTISFSNDSLWRTNYGYGLPTFYIETIDYKLGAATDIPPIPFSAIDFSKTEEALSESLVPYQGASLAVEKVVLDHSSALKVVETGIDMSGTAYSRLYYLCPKYDTTQQLNLGIFLSPNLESSIDTVLKSIKFLQSGESGSDMDNWITYKNVTHGFNVSYPKDWSIRSGYDSENEKIILDDQSRSFHLEPLEQLSKHQGFPPGISIMIHTDAEFEELVNDLQNNNEGSWQTSIDGFDATVYKRLEVAYYQLTTVPKKNIEIIVRVDTNFEMDEQFTGIYRSIRFQ